MDISSFLQPVVPSFFMFARNMTITIVILLIVQYVKFAVLVCKVFSVRNILNLAMCVPVSCTKV